MSALELKSGFRRLVEQVYSARAAGERREKYFRRLHGLRQLQTDQVGR
jgi:hypothetical protein